MLIEWIERIARKTAERVVPNAMADEWDRLARTKYADRPAVADKLRTMARKNLI